MEERLLVLPGPRLGVGLHKTGRDEKAKSKPAECQGGSGEGSGGMQREVRVQGGTQAVQGWLQAGWGLGSRPWQPTWPRGVRGNGTLRSFPGIASKEIPGCHHQPILPEKMILARPWAGPASQAKSQQSVQYKFLHLPVFHHFLHAAPPSCHPKGYCRGRRELLSKDTLKTWKGSAAKASVKIPASLHPSWASLFSTWP